MGASSEEWGPFVLKEWAPLGIEREKPLYFGGVMSLFFRRERQVRDLIQKYFVMTDEAMHEFHVAMRCFLGSGTCDEFQDSDKRLHLAESKADDLRHEIEKTLYSRALLPESRGDILGLLESFDKMPNLMEAICAMCGTQQISFPEEFREGLIELVEINVEAYCLVRETVDKLFENPKLVGEAIGPVDRKESESDKLERSLTTAVFQSKMDKADMILLRELISRIGDVSDRAENVARRMEIIALKKRI